MRSFVKCLVVCAGLLLNSSLLVSAQHAPAESPATRTEQPEVTEPQATAPTSAQDLYDQAFAALADGSRDSATQLLHTLEETFPDDPLTPKARRLLDAMAKSQEAAQPELLTIDLPPTTTPPFEAPRSVAPTQPDEGTEAPTSMARAEVIFFQTLHGMALGLELCVMAECRDAQPFVGSMMLGAGLGFGASYLMAQDGVSPGLARALTNGVLWGMVHGIELYSSTELSDHDHDLVALTATMALGQISGMALAGGMHQAWHPTAGQVSLTSSGGIWANVLTLQMLGVIQPDTMDDNLGWLLMATGDAGLLAGGLLARNEPMSTSRVLMIDAGGVLGTLTGLGIGVLATSSRFNEEDARVMFSLGLIGTMGGLVSSYVLTKSWQEDAHDGGGTTTPQLSLAPTRDGATLSMFGAW